MDISSDDHYSFLNKSYKQVGDITWKRSDFDSNSLLTSRHLFTGESLLLRKPKPKNLEVVALLSGLPFREAFTEALVSIQKGIASVLGDSLHYFVLPLNFGVEYCVFKWPGDSIQDSQLAVVVNEVSRLEINSYRYVLHGIQINPDGCIVAKGYDENGMLFKIREILKNRISFLPERQSGWAHVPIGRILEPLGSSKYIELSNMIMDLSEMLIATTKIDSIKLVHETKWYMEEKSIITSVKLK